MEQMEPDTATRVRAGGAGHDRKTGNWTYAGWLHFDSRPDDKTHIPVIQIHRHHTVFNLTKDQEADRLTALQIGKVKENADLWMRLFQNELARRVRQLGYGITLEPETGIVGFGIAGIPRELIDRNSPRRQTILEAKERIARQEGITGPERLRRLQAGLARLTRRQPSSVRSRLVSERAASRRTWGKPIPGWGNARESGRRQSPDSTWTAGSPSLSSV